MRKLSSAVLALCFAASALAAQANLPDTAYTTAAVSLRAKPDPNARSVARLAAETPVQVVACENGWCQTAVNGRNGYLPRSSHSRLNEHWWVPNETHDLAYHPDAFGRRSTSRAGPSEGRQTVC